MREPRQKQGSDHLDRKIGVMPCPVNDDLLERKLWVSANLSVTVRRLHDTDRSGWWWWIQLIPCVGFIVILVFMLLDSTPGDNRFGPNPRGYAPLM